MLPLVKPEELSLLDLALPQDDTAFDSLVKTCIHSHFRQCLRDPRLSSLFGYDAATKLPVLSPNAQVSPLDRLVAGAALLHAFVQVNWTGPSLDFDVVDCLQSSINDTQQDAQQLEAAINEAAVLSLSLPAEPAYHLTKMPALLYMARLALDMLDTPSQLDWSSCPSISVWRLRTWLIHLRILDQPVQLDEAAFLRPVEQFRDQKLLASIQAAAKSPSDQARLQDIVASCTLLVGHYHRLLAGHVPASERQANLFFLQAAKGAGLEYELTGRMGKRTKYQRDEKAQLVVLARSRERPGWVPKSQAAADESKTENGPSQDTSNDEQQPNALPLNDDTLLEKTVFTSVRPDDAGAKSDRPALSTIDVNHQPPLHPFDQALLLALSFNHANDSPGHGLTTSQIAAFVARTLDNSSENWSVYSMSLLLRSRLEASRTRTVERGVLQMQSLSDQLKLEAQAKPGYETGAPVQERLKYFHDLALPPVWELERELATRYLGIGVVKSALEIFERLEMWEEAVRCYSAVGKIDKATDLVKQLLEGQRAESQHVMTVRAGKQTAYMSKARQAKLWCALGDLEAKPEHYEQAWKISDGSSPRAMRALGGLHFGREEFEKASECLRKAVALHPIHAPSWFMLGCSDLRLEQWPGAEEAFSRCVVLDEEDAESWTNLASVQLRMVEIDANKKDADIPPEPEDDEEDIRGDMVPASADRTKTAFQCLKQAVKYKRDSWRIWENLMVIAVDLGQFSEACRSLRTIVELRGDRDGDVVVDLAVLERLVNAVTQDTAATAGEGQARGLAARVTELFDQVLLPRFSNNSRIFKAHAKLCRWRGDVKGSLEDYLKAYRCSIAQDESVETDARAFREGAEDVLELVDLLRNNEDAMPDWKFQCRSILRAFLGRTKSSFEDESMWQQLQEELQEVKAS